MTKRDFDMSLTDQSEEINSLPISDELKQAIEETLRHDEKARKEIMRVGLLKYIRKQGGEIRRKSDANEEVRRVLLSALIIKGTKKAIAAIRNNLILEKREIKKIFSKPNA